MSCDPALGDQPEEPEPAPASLCLSSGHTASPGACMGGGVGGKCPSLWPHWLQAGGAMHSDIKACC